jgi:transcriptional regulator with XRE-family HTH domain
MFAAWPPSRSKAERRFTDIGGRLRRERIRLGLTQDELSDHFGVHKSTVYLWERGDGTPSSAHLSILHRLGGDVYYVLRGRRQDHDVPEDVIHEICQAVRVLEEPGAWEKLSWEERTALLARYMGIEQTEAS